MRVIEKSQAIQPGRMTSAILETKPSAHSCLGNGTSRSVARNGDPAGRRHPLCRKSDGMCRRGRL